MELTISEFLKEERLKLSISQEEMAKLIGVSKSTYTIIENGWLFTNNKRKINVGVRVIKKIASFFNKEPAYIRSLIKNEESK